MYNCKLIVDAFSFPFNYRTLLQQDREIREEQDRQLKASVSRVKAMIKDKNGLC